MTALLIFGLGGVNNASSQGLNEVLEGEDRFWDEVVVLNTKGEHLGSLEMVLNRIEPDGRGVVSISPNDVFLYELKFPISVYSFNEEGQPILLERVVSKRELDFGALSFFIKPMAVDSLGRKVFQIMVNDSEGNRTRFYPFLYAPDSYYRRNPQDLHSSTEADILGDARKTKGTL